MLWREKKTRPSATEALPGRAEKLPVPERHFVHGRAIAPPFPPQMRRAASGSAASGGPSASSGSCPGSIPPPLATPAATPRTRLTRRCARDDRPHRGRCSWSSTGVIGYDGCSACSGRRMTRPRGCARATTSARQYRSASIATTSAQRAAAPASQAHYDEALPGPARRDHHRVSPRPGVLLRRGLPPAIPRQEPRRILRAGRHRGLSARGVGGAFPAFLSRLAPLLQEPAHAGSQRCRSGASRDPRRRQTQRCRSGASRDPRRRRTQRCRSGASRDPRPASNAAM